MDTAAWARNVGQLIRDIFGAEEEEVAEWIRSLGQLIRAGLGLAFAGITAWSIAALSSEESSFAFGRAEHIGFLVVGVLGLFLLSCKSIARQPWWRSRTLFRPDSRWGEELPDAVGALFRLSESELAQVRGLIPKRELYLRRPDGAAVLRLEVGSAR